MVNDFAQAEVDFILSIGGITVKTGQALGRDITLDQLRRDFDAVFLGLGLPGVNALRTGWRGSAVGRHRCGRLHRRSAPSAGQEQSCKVGRKVVVIGGGNTAIDIAVQTKQLGAEDVTLVYRRAPENMSATWHEQEFAQVNGVKIKHWARPGAPDRPERRGQGNRVRAHRARRSRPARSAPARPSRSCADQVFKAIGQKFVKDPVNGKAQESLDLADGKIAVNEEMKTSLRQRLGRRRLRHQRHRPDRAERRGRQGRRPRDRPHSARRDNSERLERENRHGRPSHQLHRHQVAESVLAGLGAADGQGIQRRARLQGGLGRRGLEDPGRRPADGECQLALRRAAFRRPAHDRLQQHRADHRPAARRQPARDQAGEARLARPRGRRLADGAVHRGGLEDRSCRMSRRPRPTRSS